MRSVHRLAWHPARRESFNRSWSTMVIAIDGPAGVGKSTVARLLAERLGFTYLDSGAMYRCLAVAARQREVTPDDPEAVTELARSIEIEFRDGAVHLDGRDVSSEIRTPEVTEIASRVSVHPEAREVLVSLQRKLLNEGSFVAEGRDIGTVVSPDAPLKLFLTASPEVRAARRAREMGLDPAAVLADQEERDRRDQSRAHGALRQADDAITVDTSDLDLDDVIDRLAGLAHDRGLTKR